MYKACEAVPYLGPRRSPARMQNMVCSVNGTSGRGTASLAPTAVSIAKIEMYMSLRVFIRQIIKLTKSFVNH
jgi:hypothetical protein